MSMSSSQAHFSSWTLTAHTPSFQIFPFTQNRSCSHKIKHQWAVDRWHVMSAGGNTMLGVGHGARDEGMAAWAHPKQRTLATLQRPLEDTLAAWSKESKQPIKDCCKTRPLHTKARVSSQTQPSEFKKISTSKDAIVERALNYCHSLTHVIVAARDGNSWSQCHGWILDVCSKLRSRVSQRADVFIYLFIEVWKFSGASSVWNWPLLFYLMTHGVKRRNHKSK